MKMQYYLLAISFLAMLSCTSRSSRDRIASGESVTDERNLSGISQVKISGIMNLYLSQGDNESLRIEGDEKAISLLEINENGDLLEIGYKDEDNVKNIFEDFSPDIYLTISDLRKLSFDGVVNIESVNTFQVEELIITGDGIGKIDLEIEAKMIDATFNMMGNIVLRGNVETIKLSNEGMGKIDASKLISQNMTLSSSGIGKVEVYCEDELSITVNGIGSVNYSGNPKVIKKDVNGIGKVSEN
ncbi:MAG: hypothetical protein ACI9UV_001032 [Algoriphagus sp.]|jgi:hypothetical protein